MLETMRETPAKIRKEYQDGDIDAVEFVARLKMLTARRDTAAKDAAPFIHPRLSSIDANVNTNDHEAFLAMVAEAEAHAAAG